MFIEPKPMQKVYRKKMMWVFYFRQGGWNAVQEKTWCQAKKAIVKKYGKDEGLKGQPDLGSVHTVTEAEHNSLLRLFY